MPTPDSWNITEAERLRAFGEPLRAEIAGALRAPNGGRQLDEIALRLGDEAREAMLALTRDVLRNLPPLPPPPPVSLRTRLARRYRAMRFSLGQRVHDRLFGDGEHCGGCCW